MVILLCGYCNWGFKHWMPQERSAFRISTTGFAAHADVHIML
jgi:hypothetical protein